MEDFYNNFSVTIPNLYDLCLLKLVTFVVDTYISCEKDVFDMKLLQYNISGQKFHMEEVVKKYFNKLTLPENIKHDLFLFGKRISCALFDYCSYNTSSGCKFTNPSLFWCADGTVDRVAVLFANKNQLNRDRLIEQYCKLCVIDKIHELANRSYFRNYNCGVSPIWQQYWKELYEQTNFTVSNLQMFQIAVEDSNDVGIKYFWKQLEPTEREEAFYLFLRCIMSWLRCSHAHTLKHLLCHSTIDEKTQFLKTRGKYIITCLLQSHSYTRNDILSVVKALCYLKSWSSEDFLYFCYFLQVRLWPKDIAFYDKDILFCKVWSAYEEEYGATFQVSATGMTHLEKICIRPLHHTKNILEFLSKSTMFKNNRHYILNTHGALTYFRSLPIAKLRDILKAFGLDDKEINEFSTHLLPLQAAFEQASTSSTTNF